MIQVPQIIEFLQKSPAAAQVFLAVFFFYLAWTLSHHVTIAFWIAAAAAIVYHLATSSSQIHNILSSLVTRPDVGDGPTSSPATVTTLMKAIKALIG